MPKLWINHDKIKYQPYWKELLEPGAMQMTEDEIISGITALEAKYPDIKAWITFECLYIAVLSRNQRLIQLLTNWFEHRQMYFTREGKFHNYSETYPDNWNIQYSVRQDRPALALCGDYNLPVYLHRMDWESSSPNFCHVIQDWISNDWSPAIEDLLARALAVNPIQWASVECCSMNDYPEISKFVNCISHTIYKNGDTVSYFRRCGLAPTPICDGEKVEKIVWHTGRTRCKMCPLRENCNNEHHDFSNCCIPENITEPLAMTPYECVLAHAVKIRRQRLRGVLRCTSILAGKMLHSRWRPGTGRHFKSAQSRWNFEVISADKK